jgi:hypothetical protein
LETAVIVHLLLNLRGLIGRNAFTELFATEETLEDEVRAARFGLAGSGFKELFAQRASAQMINGL